MKIMLDEHEINMSVEDYKHLWDKDGNSKDSIIINILIVSLISADSLTQG